MNAITIDATWEELRTRESWLAWLGIAKEEAPDTYDWWHTDEGCRGCLHFDANGIWCNLVELPASRNPYLGTLGMACCGAGFESDEPQLTLALPSNDIPF